MMGMREGRVSGDAFFRLARRKLGFIARDVWRGWRRKLPMWVEYEDVEQALHVQVLHYVPKWRPERGERIWDYVIWSAVHRTQRQIHKWRGAKIHGNEGKNESRAELAFSRVFRNDPQYQEDASSRIDVVLSRHAPLPEPPEDGLDHDAEYEDLLRQARTPREAIVLRALREHGTIHGAARFIWDDFSLRIECGVTSDEAQVARVVREVVEAVARRHLVRVPVDLWDAIDEQDERARDERAA